MIIYKLAEPLRAYLQQEAEKGKSIGFVPTMGALHPGHISLVSQSKQNNDLTVCSIFVNPTQFNNKEDFANYPITIGRDIEMLEMAGCDLLFLPSVSQIYPEQFKAPHYDLGFVETVLEGAHRPGHFQGVCQVVDLLLGIVEPKRLYLGQKDYQQCMVIKKLLEITGRTTELVIAPTVRETSGLAMSSRNLRLSDEERVLATAIYEALVRIRKELPLYPIHELVQKAEADLEAKGFNVDYVAIAGAGDLREAKSKDEALVALIAASIGPVRLIDNMLIN